jgi:GH24 family phage-related lysozyme (muramidase)
VVKLPTVPRRFITTQVTRSALSESERAAPYRELGRALDNLGQGISDVAETVGEEQGRKAVVYDEAGNPSYEEMPLFTGRAGRAYNRSAQVAFMAAKETQAQVDLQRLRIQHANDPDGFRAASEAYLSQSLSNAPEAARPAVQASLGRAIAGHTTGLMADKYRIDTARDADRFKTREQQLDRDLTTLAETGGVDTDEYRQKWQDYRAIIEEQQADPRFKVSRETAEERLQQRFRNSEVAVITGDARRIFNATGDLAGTFKRVETLLDEPSLKLTPEEKITYRNRIVSAVQGSAAVRAADIDQLKLRAGSMVTSLQNGELKPDNESISGLIAQARGLRQYGLASQLTAARTVAQYTGMITAGLPGARAQAMRDLREQLASQARGDVASSGGGSAAALLRRFEGFRETPYWDVNALRTGFGSDTVTRPDGTVVPVTAGTRVSREDAERDLARRVTEFEGVATGQVGEAAWKALPDNARAGLTSVAYNYGELPDSVVAAVRTGDVHEIARAVYGLRGHNGGINADRRQSEANVIRGVAGGLGADPAVSQAYGAAVQRVQKIYDDSAKEVFDRVEAAHKAGQQATPDEYAALAELAPMIGDAKLRKSIGEHFAAEGGAQAVMAEGPVRAREILDGLNEAAAQGKAPPAARDVADRVQKQLKNVETVVKDDTSQAAQLYMPEVARPTAPLDLSSPEALAAGIDARQRNQRLVQHWASDMEVGGLFSDRDIEALKYGLANGSTEQVVATLNTMTRTLSADDWRVAFGKDGLRDALLGLTTTGDPQKMQAAYALLDVERRRNPLEFEQRFTKDARVRLDDWITRQSTMSPGQIAEEQRRYEDPMQRKAREDAREAALKLVDKVTPQDIVNRMGGWTYTFLGSGFAPGVPASADAAVLPRKMLNEWKQEFADYYVRSGNEGQAGKLAMQAVQKKWRPSALAGGAIMEHPPEASYPLVDDSHAWLKAQADEKIVSRMLEFTGDTERYAPVIRGFKVQPVIDYRLVADPTTEADIRQGRPPSYQVVIQRDGQYEVMPGRLSFDPAQAQEAARARFEAERGRRDEQRIVGLNDTGGAARAQGDNIAGLVERGNIDLTTRPRVPNGDDTSTVLSMSFEEDGKEILIPMVSDDGRILTEDEAIKQYRKTGKHLGKFKTPEDATAYAEELHLTEEAKL